MCGDDFRPWLRNTEVEQLGMRRSTLLNDDDIGGLQIAVKNAAFVGTMQCLFYRAGALSARRASVVEMICLGFELAGRCQRRSRVT